MLTNTLHKDKNQINLKYINIHKTDGELKVRGHEGVGNFKVDRDHLSEN